MKKTIYEIEAWVCNNKLTTNIYRKFLINSDLNIMELGVITLSSFRINFLSFPDIYFINKTVKKKLEEFAKKDDITMNDLMKYTDSFIGSHWDESYQYEFGAAEYYKEKNGFELPKRFNPKPPTTKIKKVLPNVDDWILLYYKEVEIYLSVKDIKKNQEINDDEFQLEKYYFKVLDAKYYGFVETENYRLIADNNDDFKKIFDRFTCDKLQWPSNRLLKKVSGLTYMSDDEHIAFLMKIAKEYNGVLKYDVGAKNWPKGYNKPTKENKSKKLHNIIDIETFDCEDAKIDELNQYALVWAIANILTINRFGFEIPE
ncbi:hypothetical protein NPA07_04650 [Mycoplasmopsis caviae]|uniref:Uncharacterized protein n=1 Tax=Mycoplasmopsis caviae TaxID=55603 RepID=A0A3P8KX45_9BACT|nr:hypothetical protein [Mycoplasmopsis caviae]UUD35067.1 hypothetical protein NPA07_04650 [Mycoplasmopsis caviae]VDR42107.1 Uncharacterised protein [Mycoplasmopsis caviae]